ncbi:MAG: DUF6122 family protein [Flavobacteriaceae bacterium]
MRFIIHYFLHLGFPIVLAFVFYRKEWIKVSLLFLSTMLVDLDHLWATPVYDLNRCSIGFHFLHQYGAITIYIVLLFLKKPFHFIGLGLLLHMLTDAVDCVLMI